MKIFAPKLVRGDEVRVIAPAMSLKNISQDNINIATQTLELLGLNVTFGKHVNEQDIFGSSSIQSRLDDLHEAFSDKNVKAILPVIGGWNSNQLLSYIDYDLIKRNPKFFCGYSDITALQNAIYYKTGLITYSGPHYSSFAMKRGFDYTLEYFKRIFFKNSLITLKSSSEWSDDAWYKDQENRVFHKNQGHWIIYPGDAQGTIVGGNLSTFLLLHGTPYMPSLKNTILFIEADSITEGHCVPEFDRTFQALIHQPEFSEVKGVVIGRFEQKFGMDREKLELIIGSKPALKNLPIIANADFGHTTPMFTFPIGGTCEIKTKEASKVTIAVY